MKWPLALLAGILCVLFWRVPTSDDDIVALVEGTSMITVLRRDFAEETTKPSPSKVKQPVAEERHYSIDVKECRLEHVISKPRTRSSSEVTWEMRVPIHSWSMTYTKTRANDNPKATWTSKIKSFVVNDEAITEPERRYAFLHFYLVSSAHPKSHTFGEALVERILTDDSIKETLAESTWTTTALHYGLLHGSLGPITTPR